MNNPLPDMNDMGKILANYVTWKALVYILAGSLIYSLSALAWVNHELNDRLRSEDVTEIRGDIKIIKACLINGECAPRTDGG